MNLADKVVLLDNVQFSRPSWINRNWLAGADGRVPFTFAVQNPGSKTLIHDVKLSDPARHKTRFLKTLQTLYGRAPYYHRGLSAATQAFDYDDILLADLAIRCVKAINHALGIKTPLQRACDRYPHPPAGAEALVLHICQEEKADSYINPEGGQHLYTRNAFQAVGIQLEFLKSCDKPYSRNGRPFYQRLSVLDALMYCSDEELSDLLGSCCIMDQGSER